VSGFGAQQAELLRGFPNTHVLLALLRDGFHEQSPGGTVGIRSDGSPELDYPLTDFVMEGARRALREMARIQFAAGARRVFPVHEVGEPCTTEAQALAAIDALPMKPLLAKVVSAHVMGGCGMAAQARHGVVRPDGLHWQIDNLSVHDGSIFPTSIGANPQLSIYGIVNRLAQGLARRMGAREVILA
jgi:choline dehydrogenase-like flavoprotein